VRDANEATQQMRADTPVFAVVDAGVNGATGSRQHRVTGVLAADGSGWTATFDPLATDRRPEIRSDGVYFSFKGATLTAKAFDRVLPGLGLWIVPATAFLFAFSTMISWSYYGEQGVVYLLGSRAVLTYRVLFCLLILVSTSPFIRTEHELDVLSTLGTGVMLWANIPIMLLFGPMAMRAYHEYMDKLKRGVFHGHALPPVTDVVEGHDVE
jgi:AGCS family alanine or glycine:cation symporter